LCQNGGGDANGGARPPSGLALRGSGFRNLRTKKSATRTNLDISCREPPVRPRGIGDSRTSLGHSETERYSTGTKSCTTRTGMDMPPAGMMMRRGGLGTTRTGMRNFRTVGAIPGPGMAIPPGGIGRSRTRIRLFRTVGGDRGPLGEVEDRRDHAGARRGDARAPRAPARQRLGGVLTDTGEGAALVQKRPAEPAHAGEGREPGELRNPAATDSIGFYDDQAG